MFLPQDVKLAARCSGKYRLADACSVDYGADASALVLIGDGTEDVVVLGAIALAVDRAYEGESHPVVRLAVSGHKRYASIGALAKILDESAADRLCCALLIIDQEQDDLEDVRGGIARALREHGFDPGSPDPEVFHGGRLLRFRDVRRGSRNLELSVCVSGLDEGGPGRRAIEDHLLSAAGILGEVYGGRRDPKDAWDELDDGRKREAVRILATEEGARRHALQLYDALAELVTIHAGRS
ncbi:MAG: hypothetical protein ACP5ID_06165 [Conexivisphaera sp.]